MSGKVVRGVLSRWVRRKTYGLDEVDAMASHSGGPATLAKVLNVFDLTLLGVGSTLGVGIYVLAGSVALNTAGPAVCISFLVAAIASAFAAMAYAEFGARVPKAGSAYIYTYVTVGEMIAFIIGWNLILEYMIGTASVARAFSANLDALTNKTMSAAFEQYFPINAPGLSPYCDFFSLTITLALSVLLGLGVRSSATFTNIFTFVNVTVVLFVIIGGAINADINNWKIPADQIPEGYGTGGFLPYGFAGVMAGASKCFFAFVGFDSIASTGEEAKNAKRSIPLSINLTLAIVFVAYFSVSTVITLMWPYYLQDPDTPLVYAFQQIGWDIAAWTISIGSLFGLAASLLGCMIPLPRIIYAKAKDGLIFRFLCYVSPRFQTPVVATAIAGVFAAILGAIFDLESLVDMMSIGTLLAYTLVSISVLILRYEQTEEDVRLENERLDQGDNGESLKAWNRKPTKQSSRNAIYATLTFCAFTCGFCGVLLGLETSDDPWLFFGIGICVGPMLLIMLFMVMLPRSRTKLYFKVPAVPIIPCLSVIINTYLMFKLDYHTWIRFGVWMAIGFVMYFGYGMWNSSEEYVRRGKIPPGGSAPLPVLATDEEPKPLNGDAMKMRAIPITSFDDNEFVKDRAVPITPVDVKVDPFSVGMVTMAAALVQSSSPKSQQELILESHLAAQAVFDEASKSRHSDMGQAVFESHLAAVKVFEQARQERQMQAQQAMLLESHHRAEQVFQQLRINKQAEALEMQQQMAVLMQQAGVLHEQLDQLFKNIEKEPLNETSAPVAKRRSIKPPPSPMNAVMQELMAKAATIDPDEEATENNNLPIIVEPPTPTSNNNTVTTPRKASTNSSDETSTSALMLDELKKVFISQGKTPPEMGDDSTEAKGDVNISPNFVQGLNTSSTGTTVAE